MNELVPEKYQDVNFFDTEGVIFYRKAKITSNDNLKKEYLERSKKLLQYAKDLAKRQHLLKYEIRTIEENLKNTNNFSEIMKNRNS